MVGAGGGYDAGVGGESRVSSVGGGATVALERKGPTKNLEGLKRRRQGWAMGSTKGGLKADPGGTPASMPPFPQLVRESAAISGVE